MVQEIRRIMFEEEELLSAYASYARMHINFLPDGTIVRCKPEITGVKITLAGPSGYLMDYTVREPDAVRPLIRYCLENNIIIPKDGQKSLYIRDGRASLYIVYDLDAEISHSRHYTQPSLAPKDVQRLAKPIVSGSAS